MTDLLLPGLAGGAQGMASVATLRLIEQLKAQAAEEAFQRQRQLEGERAGRRDEASARDFAQQLALSLAGRGVAAPTGATPEAMLDLLTRNVVSTQEKADEEANLERLLGIKESREQRKFDERDAERRSRESDALIAQRLASARASDALASSPGRTGDTTPQESIEERRRQATEILKRATAIERNARQDIQTEIQNLGDPLYTGNLGYSPAEAAQRTQELQARLGTIREESLAAAQAEFGNVAGVEPPVADAEEGDDPREDAIRDALRQAVTAGDSPDQALRDLLQYGIPLERARELVQEIYGARALVPQISAPE